MTTRPPPWLEDETDIVRLLNIFIDRLDQQPATARTHAVGLNLNEKTFPALFQLGDEADRLWDLIASLDEDHRLIHITLKKQRDPFAPRYLQARLRLREESEARLRDWLGRPAGLSPLQQWRNAVANQREQFPGEIDKLASHRIVAPGQDDATVVAAFAAIRTYQNQSLSLRQLSSRCFWGDSKFLDNRETLVRALFPAIRISPRPVLVNVFLPESIEGVLFIENQDSYTQAITAQQDTFKHLALIYVAGFRGSAARIRETDGASLHYHSVSPTTRRSEFERWWFRQMHTDWPVHFWGDLDYSGMGILKALKKRFVEISAWRKGYIPMLERLQQGKGHPPVLADKQAQKDPGNTGCQFADTVLLPLIRERLAFVDQEAWSYPPLDR